MKRTGLVVSYVAAVLISAVASAQITFPKKFPRIPVERLPGLDRIPGLDKILGKETPITTSFADAMTEVSLLDEYDPAGAVPMGAAQRDEDGVFILNPGAYTFEAQSFCMHAGTHGPSGGEGYLFAPLLGPKAPIVRSIFRRSVAHPEIDQTQIQVLIWAIIARTNLSDMRPKDRAVAMTLLTPKELFDLNGGALGIIPEELKQRALAGLPPVARQIVEAENKIRSMLTQTNASFEELERVAVLAGAPPRSEGDRIVPRGRWSYHPDGYFVRFLPSGYSRTHIDLYVPEPFAVDRDEDGRIVGLSSSSAESLEITYQISSAAVARGVAAHPFRSITFRSAPDGETSVRNRGWTLSGVPGEGRVRASGASTFADLPQRYDLARVRKQEFSTLIRQTRRTKGEISIPDTSLTDLVDLASLYEAVRGLEQGAAERLILEAWMATYHRQFGVAPPQVASLADQGLPGAPDGTTNVDPSGTVGTPGETGRQRLAQSGRCQKPCQCPDNEDVCAALKAAAAISQSALPRSTGSREGVSNVPEGGARTPDAVRQFKNQMGPVLDEMARDFCTMPQIPELKDTLNSLDPSKAGEVSEMLKIAKIDRILDNMIAQLCGPPPAPPSPKPKKKKCADGSDPDPGGEQAVEQIKSALEEAIKQAEEELIGNDKIKRVKDLQKALGFWNQITSAGCIPPQVLSLVLSVLNGRTDMCMDMCHETAKWIVSMTGNQAAYGANVKACGAGCL